MKPTYYNFKNRLAQFREEESLNVFWDKCWSSYDVTARMKHYRKGKLDDFESIFSKHLSKGPAPILEAGCGLGQLVMGLSVRGYPVEGIDYSSKTIERVRSVYPELNIRYGDIYHLEAGDQFYGGYISIGVVEHNPKGPEEALKEACRVLRPDGKAFISVPYLNSLRKKILKTAEFPEKKLISQEDKYFYQYFFSKEEFQGMLENAGFEIIEFFPYGVFPCLTRDTFWGRWLEKHQFFHWRIRKFFLHFSKNLPAIINLHCAHMMMFVCRSKENKNAR